jgi:nitrite reductase/ring-hydroxylating ferredoxin subunit
MNINDGCNRRSFIQLTIAALTLGELTSLLADPVTTSPSPTPAATPAGPSPSPVPTTPSTMDLGPATDFPTDKVYTNFYEKGWFLVRKEGKYFALTDVCPHKGGPILAQPDGTFACKWHHATFDAEGHVTKKPAKSDLKVYPVDLDDKGHLVITLPAVVPLPPKPKPGAGSPTPQAAAPTKAPAA